MRANFTGHSRPDQDGAQQTRRQQRRGLFEGIMYGLRGVGKTVLLNRIRLDAEADGVACIPIEAPEGRSLPAILLPALRSCLIRMSRGKSAASALRKAMATVAAFAQVFKMKYEDVEVSIDLEPAIGVADSGDLENDLADFAVGYDCRNGRCHCAIGQQFLSGSI